MKASKCVCAATGDHTPEQIPEMINNPLGYLWLLNMQNTTTVAYAGHPGARVGRKAAVRWMITEMLTTHPTMGETPEHQHGNQGEHPRRKP